VFCFVPQMRDLGGTDRMVYMTHSWLMSFFLNCPCSDLTPGQAESPTCTALGLNTPSDFRADPGAALPDTYVVRKTAFLFCFFEFFPMFVPSLSWQNDRFYI
jgi:hypothetical protein